MSGCAYFRDLVIELPLAPADPEQGWVEIPKPFIRGRREGYRETVRYPRKEGGGEVRLFYLRWQPETDESVQPYIITTAIGESDEAMTVEEDGEE